MKYDIVAEEHSVIYNLVRFFYLQFKDGLLYRILVFDKIKR